MSETIREMRSKKGRKKERIYIRPEDVLRIRTQVLDVTQDALANELLDPRDGHPITPGLISKWENGVRSVPLWAAQHIKLLEEEAVKIDTGRE